jgi:branched-chain amino acid transport system substrate-binding protein
MNTPSRPFSVSTRLLTAIVALILVISFASSPVVTRGQSGTPAATAAASQCASVADKGKTIKIGAVVPLTGRFAAGGEQIQNGYLLGIEDINKAGGVVVNCEKMQLELKVLDDESDPTKTVQRMETLFSDDQVLVYLGGFGSDLHAAAAAIAEKNKTPYLGVAFALYGIHQKGFKYLFSPFPKSPSLVKASFDMLDTLSPKPTKVGIFAEKTDWGAEMRDLWSKEAKTRGYDLTTDEQYAPGAKDFSTMILNAKNAGTEVIVALPTPPDGVAIVKQMKELSYTPKLSIFIRAADNGGAWSQGLGKDGDSFALMPGWDPAVKFPGAADMSKRYMDKFNKPAQATAGPAYAVIQILADALNRAKAADRDAIRDAIAATDLKESVIGPVKFNADGTGQVTTTIDQYQGGKQILVWPPDQATSPLVYPAKAFADR